MAMPLGSSGWNSLWRGLNARAQFRVTDNPMMDTLHQPVTRALRAHPTSMCVGWGGRIERQFRGNITPSRNKDCNQPQGQQCSMALEWRAIPDTRPGAEAGTAWRPCFCRAMRQGLRKGRASLSRLISLCQGAVGYHDGGQTQPRSRGMASSWKRPRRREHIRHVLALLPSSNLSRVRTIHLLDSCIPYTTCVARLASIPWLHQPRWPFPALEQSISFHVHHQVHLTLTPEDDSTPGHDRCD